MKKIITFIIILLCFSLFYYPLKGFSINGEHVLQNKCGKCHGDLKIASAFSPAKYASIQWERFFTRNKHNRKKDISNELTLAEIEAVKTYLIQHAADSDQPEAIGLK